MNDDEFGQMVRRREIFQALAKGATREDWPNLWEQAERSARVGAMQSRSRSSIPMASIARWPRTSAPAGRSTPVILERMRQ